MIHAFYILKSNAKKFKILGKGKQINYNNGYLKLINM